MSSRKRSRTQSVTKSETTKKPKKYRARPHLRVRGGGDATTTRTRSKSASTRRKKAKSPRRPVANESVVALLKKRRLEDWSNKEVLGWCKCISKSAVYTKAVVEKKWTGPKLLKLEYSTAKSAESQLMKALGPTSLKSDARFILKEIKALRIANSQLNGCKPLPIKLRNALVADMLKDRRHCGKCTLAVEMILQFAIEMTEVRLPPVTTMREVSGFDDAVLSAFKDSCDQKTFSDLRFTYDGLWKQPLECGSWLWHRLSWCLATGHCSVLKSELSKAQWTFFLQNATDNSDAALGCKASGYRTPDSALLKAVRF